MRLEALEELVRTGDDAFGVDARHRSVDLEEAHPDVEPETPIGGEGDDPGIDVELPIALIQKGDVLLDLRADVAQRFLGK